MMDYNALIQQITAGSTKALARTITIVENEVSGYDLLLQSLPTSAKKIIGITGPPGAGKSTLVDALIAELLKQDKKIGVLCIDPSSPFNRGALLGDRIRMSRWYNSPDVFIRSLASRGSLGGLSPKIIEITDVMKTAPFDHIIVETIGVGQSEIEIAGLSDTTVVVIVPEAGDEIQAMKAGLMEIADIFVVNKADRPGADTFVKNLKYMQAQAFSKIKTSIPVLKTIASQNAGIENLMKEILLHQQSDRLHDKKFWLLAEKAYQLIQQKKMRDISKADLLELIKRKYKEQSFNLYDMIYTLQGIN